MDATERDELVGYLARTNHESHARAVRLGIERPSVWRELPRDDGRGHGYRLDGGRYVTYGPDEEHAWAAGSEPWAADPLAYRLDGDRVLRSCDLDDYDSLPADVRRALRSDASLVCDIVLEGATGHYGPMTSREVEGCVQACAYALGIPETDARAVRGVRDNVRDILDALAVPYDV